MPEQNSDKEARDMVSKHIASHIGKSSTLQSQVQEIAKQAEQVNKRTDAASLKRDLQDLGFNEEEMHTLEFVYEIMRESIRDLPYRRRVHIIINATRAAMVAGRAAYEHMIDLQKQK